MAKEGFETIKSVLLILFVTVGVGLVLVLWVQGFTDSGSTDAGFISQNNATGGSLGATHTPLTSSPAAKTTVPQATPTAQAKTPTRALTATTTVLSTQSKPTQTLDATQIWEGEQKDQ
jgi:hypothetical protein